MRLPIISADNSLQQKMFFYLTLFLSLGFLLVIFSKMGQPPFSDFYFNSDMFYDPVIYNDLIKDGSGIAGWHFNAAPNFFPDMFIYFIYMGLSQDLFIANFLFSCTQVFLILGLGWAILYQLNKKVFFANATWMNLLFFLFLLIPVFSERFRFTFNILSISYHMGSFIMFLLSLNFLFSYLRKKKVASLLLLTIAVILGSFNDRLYISQFTLSVLPLSLLLFRKKHLKNLGLPLISIVSGTALGLLFFRFFSASQSITVISTDFKMLNFANTANSWETFWEYIFEVIRNYGAERWIIILYLLTLLLLAYLNISKLKSYFSKDNGAQDPQDYILLIMFIYLPVTLLSPVLNGAFKSESILRLNIMALLAGLLFLPAVLNSLPLRQKKELSAFNYLSPALILAFSILLIVKVSGTETKKGLSEYFNYYPEQVQKVDELIKEHDLKYGISRYWMAKKMMMLSREDLRLYAVYKGSTTPWYHSTNENWYHPGGKGRHKDPQFNFIVMDSETYNSSLPKHFGNQMDTIYFDLEMDLTVIKLPEFTFERGSKKVVLLEDWQIQTRSDTIK